MTDNAHIIQRILVSVHGGSELQSFQLRSRMEDLCSKAIPQRLEKVFSSYDTEEIIELPSIKLNVEVSDLSLLEQKILDQCGTEVEKLLRISADRIRQQQKKNETAGKEIASPQRATLHSINDVLFFFLEHGTLPWWTNYKSL